MRDLKFLLVTSVAYVTQLAYSNVIDLSDSRWTLSNPSLNISVAARLPSQAHLDLYAAQKIDDPYFGLNDFNLRWVAETNWTYTSTPLSFRSSDTSYTYLLFNGLDTFTTIELCGEHVASTNNQFRQHFFEISQIVKRCPGEIILSINFGSAPNIANEIAAQPNQEEWPYGVEIPFEYPNRQFIRKEQSDFGWDWGPAFAPAGPWQPAYVIELGASAIHLRNSLVDIYRLGQLNNLPPSQDQPWVLNASVDFLGQLPQNAGLAYQLLDANNSTITAGHLSNVTVGDGSITGNTIVPSEKVDLWWPNGLGPQALYYLTIAVVGADDHLLTSTNKRVGFRTIVLNEGVITEEQLSQGIAPGNNWHFEINGHEFYAKGSNFIPPDAFWPRVTEDRIRQLFESATDGNQNMLRVWSSGAYLPDFAYDIADEMGLLLWSEFQFGDALYPVEPEFLDNVREEAIYNTRRVNHHPSLAFWAGGNEMENLELPTAKKAAPDEYPRYLAEYETLFLRTLLPAVFENSRSISYAPSSTSNGYLVLNFSLPIPMIERYDNKTPGSIYGETDYYNYDSSVAFDYSTYPVGRFSNEFGYHSMPSLQTWRQAISASDLHFNSSTIMLRNHHYPPGGLNTSNYYNTSLGMGEMTLAAERWYPVPHKEDPIANFSAWCHTTQIFQADFYKSQIMFYRRGSGMPERQLGSLYWQLEDIWQAPTWAGIEYDGRWKVLHYVARDIYQPVIISPFFNSMTESLEVYVTSDLWSTATGTANFTWYDWSGNRLNVSTAPSASLTVGPLNTTLVLGANTNETLSGYDLANVILVCEVSVDAQLPNSNVTQTLTHQNWFHPTSLAESKLVDPKLTLSYSNTTNKFVVKATTGVAVWAWLDHPADVVLSFDENAFLLLPGQAKEVGYKIRSGSISDEWIDKVTVRSLWNNTVP
ncbi:glycoside hydrolase family 2 protein [Aplosporella prunicola CBS 121167]|uniref:Beta-mannosidase A n=1 Tax=Aplosporella prunicola CBS 121167 TaxID=1176127 RepID=A0A6A6BRI9_9PEZI|nr:glycoside hydrolase family 2 protein [Aplosporella prunicola CBS 121167]KAF2145191.1 glycoside hydrolase family 2 protein [Aplosporella prunicola CBS 121167]